ncbi:MAG: DNA polymerase III subunit delta [Myxococcales bacterium]|nr:MAG: DNA polymerase III subunit delta [Myxococcales bacterium]
MAAPKSKRKTQRQTPEEFLAAVRQGDVAPAYYFHAGDADRFGGAKQKASPYNDYLLDGALDALQRAIVGGSLRDFNYAVFVASDGTLPQAIAIAETYPMMRPRRLVIVKEAHEARADDWRAALRYLENPAPTTCLVFIGESLPGPSKGGAEAKAAVEAGCVLVRFAPFTKAKEVQPYLQTEIKRRGKKMERAAETLLFDLAGFDLNELSLALDKLALYVAERETIALADVEQCIAKTRLDAVWGLQDALAERHLGRALAQFDAFLENARTEDELFLMGSLVRFLRDLLDIRLLLDGGAPAAEIAKAIGGNPWATNKKIDQARAHTAQSLAAALDALHRTDVALRTSRAPNEALFARFAMRVAGLRRR